MNGSTCLHFSPFQKRRANKIKAILEKCDISIDFTVSNGTNRAFPDR